jgi:hypothetical protein
MWRLRRQRDQDAPTSLVGRPSRAAALSGESIASRDRRKRENGKGIQRDYIHESEWRLPIF